MKGHLLTPFTKVCGVGWIYGESMVNLSCDELQPFAMWIFIHIAKVSLPVLCFLAGFCGHLFDCFVIMTRQVQSYL